MLGNEKLTPVKLIKIRIETLEREIAREEIELKLDKEVITGSQKAIKQFKDEVQDLRNALKILGKKK